jgi:hypothetical protein
VANGRVKAHSGRPLHISISAFWSELCVVLLGMDRWMASILRVEQLQVFRKNINQYFSFRVFLGRVRPPLFVRTRNLIKSTATFSLQHPCFFFLTSIISICHFHLGFSSICHFFFYSKEAGDILHYYYTTHTRARLRGMWESGEGAVEMCAFFILVVYR